MVGSQGDWAHRKGKHNRSRSIGKSHVIFPDGCQDTKALYWLECPFTFLTFLFFLIVIYIFFSPSSSSFSQGGFFIDLKCVHFIYLHRVSTQHSSTSKTYWYFCKSRRFLRRARVHSYILVCVHLDNSINQVHKDKKKCTHTYCFSLLH